MQDSWSGRLEGLVEGEEGEEEEEDDEETEEEGESDLVCNPPLFHVPLSSECGTYGP